MIAPAGPDLVRWQDQIQFREPAVPECRNWQTNRTQNPAHFTGRVGSSPTSGTNPNPKTQGFFFIFGSATAVPPRLNHAFRMFYAPFCVAPTDAALSLSILALRGPSQILPLSRIENRRRK